jgi:pyruvate kinase
VANAIFDGSDAVMLSGETAFGKYPEESVTMMSKIISEAEKGRYYRLHTERRGKELGPLSSSRSICHIAYISANDIKANFIIVFSESGFSAQIMSKYRPDVPIIAITPNIKTFRKMALYWGVVPSKVNGHLEIHKDLKELDRHLKENGLAKAGDKLVVTAGAYSNEGGTNMLRLHRLL